MNPLTDEDIDDLLYDEPASVPPEAETPVQTVIQQHADAVRSLLHIDGVTRADLVFAAQQFQSLRSESLNLAASLNGGGPR